MQMQSNAVKMHGPNPLMGRERSRAWGTYPEELCDKYARCAISQFLLMGKEEFLHYKEMMMKLKETIDGYKAKSEKASPGSNKASSQQSSPARAQSAHREKQAKTEASESPDFGASSSPATSSSMEEKGGGHEGSDSTKETKGPALEPVTMHTCVGGDGKFGMLKSRNIQSPEDDTAYTGA